MDILQEPAARPAGEAVVAPAARRRPVGGEAAQPLGLAVLCLLALAVGVITGFGAIVFRDLVGLAHNVFFEGRFSLRYDANVFTPASPWGPLVVLVPVAGGLIVTFLVSTFAPEARGHGVPEVMDAIYYKAGVIRPVVVVVKSLASALSIGSGAAVGREGPIIQIGSALGSTMGQIVRMPVGQRIVLVAAGAGAGIAATFNTPIGGVMFAVELMLPEVSARSFLPVALATGTATFIGRWFLGDEPAFAVPRLAPMSADAGAALVLCLYALLGAVTGAAAAGFVRGLHWVETLLARIRGRYLRNILGMLSIGVLIYVLRAGFGQYYVDGVGYATIQSILEGGLAAAGLLFLLFVCKLLATSVSLGAGASGGIFSPSLFMGATIGGGFAALLSALHVPLAVDVPSFAMVGMGAMVGGGTGAALTAVVMVFEMTRDYDIVLPMILAVALAVGVRRLLSRESIYTAKLVPRGHAIPKALHANMFLVRRAREVMDTDVVLAAPDTSFDAFLAREGGRPRVRHVVVVDGRRILGVLRVNMALGQAVERGRSDVTLRDLMSRDFTIAREDDIAYAVIQRMWRKRAVMALVVRGRGVPRPADILGVVTKERVADSVAESIQVYPAARGAAAE